MKPHSQKIRIEAVRLHREEQQSKSEISRQLGVSYKTISTWLKRYKEAGKQGLLPNYSDCGKQPIYSPAIIDKAITYKGHHLEWGAGFILVKLRGDFPNTDLPSERRLQQIFRSKKLQAKKSKPPRGKAKWAKKAFDRVQVDAKERLKTADGKDCCYLNFTDEATGSVLDAFVFPLCSNL